MNFSELVTAVYGETGRPDLATETANAVRSTLLSIHSQDDFAPDEFAMLLANTNNDNPWAIELSTVNTATSSAFSVYHLTVVNAGSVTSYAPQDVIGSPVHAVRKIRKVFATDSSGVPLFELNRQSSDDLFDDYGFAKTNTWRQLSGVLSVKSPAPIAGVLVHYMGFPIVDPASFDSWIAAEVPYYVVHAAAAAVLGGTVGKLDEAQQQMALARTFLGSILERTI